MASWTGIGKTPNDVKSWESSPILVTVSSCDWCFNFVLVFVEDNNGAHYHFKLSLNEAKKIGICPGDTFYVTLRISQISIFDGIHNITEAIKIQKV